MPETTVLTWTLITSNVLATVVLAIVAIYNRRAFVAAVRAEGEKTRKQIEEALPGGRAEVLRKLADDAIGHAEQSARVQVEKRGGAPWTWRDKQANALHWAALQCTALKLGFDQATLDRAIESRLATHPAKMAVAKEQE